MTPSPELQKVFDKMQEIADDVTKELKIINGPWMFTAIVNDAVRRLEELHDSLTDEMRRELRKLESDILKEKKELKERNESLDKRLEMVRVLLI